MKKPTCCLTIRGNITAALAAVSTIEEPYLHYYGTGFLAIFFNEDKDSGLSDKAVAYKYLAVNWSELVVTEQITFNINNDKGYDKHYQFVAGVKLVGDDTIRNIGVDLGTGLDDTYPDLTADNVPTILTLKAYDALVDKFEELKTAEKVEIEYFKWAHVIPMEIICNQNNKRALPWVDDYYAPKFFVGKHYLTYDGTMVLLTNDTSDRFSGKGGQSYICIRGNDNVYRYVYSGRATGSDHDYSSPKNLLPTPLTEDQIAEYSDQEHIVHAVWDMDRARREFGIVVKDMSIIENFLEKNVSKEGSLFSECGELMSDPTMPMLERCKIIKHDNVVARIASYEIHDSHIVFKLKPAKTDKAKRLFDGPYSFRMGIRAITDTSLSETEFEDGEPKVIKNVIDVITWDVFAD